MRKLIWLIVVLAVIWSGWWFAASKGLEHAIRRGFAAQMDAGKDAGFDRIVSQGYPTTIKTTVQSARLALGNMNVTADSLGLEVAPWWPGDVKLILPETPVAFVTGFLRNTVKVLDGAAHLRLTPGSKLAFDSFSILGAAWEFRLAGAPTLAGSDLHASLFHEKDTQARYRFQARIDALKPGTPLRTLLRLPQTWPQTLDVARADMDLTFDKPWDRVALSNTPPRPKALNVNQMELAWGDLRLRLQGSLQFDATGVPSGALTLRADNWRGMLSMAQTAGVLSADAVKQLERNVLPLAAADGNPRVLDTVITFENGMMSAGQWQLGPAPRF